MGNPVHQMIQGEARHRRAGFTLIEALVALFVIGTATTILFSLYTNSLKLGRASKSNDVATNIAEEYMNELRVHPELFVWPDYEIESSEDGLRPIVLKDKGDDSIFMVSPSNAEAPDERAYNHDKDLYRGYTWSAFARLNEKTDTYVEIMIQIQWQDGGAYRNLCLTSLLPRSRAEGVG